MSRYLTLQQLIDAKACDSQVNKFKAMFGEKVRVTQRLAVKVADEFDFRFAARKFLRAPALAEYLRTVQAAYDVYRSGHRHGWAKYVSTRARAFAKLYNSEKRS